MKTVPILRVGKAPYRTCPICGHTHWCGVAADGSFAICMRVPSDRSARNGGYVHRLNGGVVSDVEAHRPMPDTPRAGAAALDRAYRQLLSGLILSPEHQVALLQRGLTPTQVLWGMYRTLPRDVRQRQQAVKRVRCPKGVPGFYRDDGAFGAEWALHGRPGLLVPIRNLAGQIVALQSRRDDPPEGQTADSPKYVWVSSSGLPGGCSPGAPLHVARPRRLWQSAVWVTEGCFKAEVAARVLGAFVISVQGVTNWRDVPATVRALNAQRVVVAFDADKATNHAVAKASVELQAALQAAGFIVQEARWPLEAGKGLDDVLVRHAFQEVKVA